MLRDKIPKKKNPQKTLKIIKKDMVWTVYFFWNYYCSSQYFNTKDNIKNIKLLICYFFF